MPTVTKILGGFSVILAVGLIFLWFAVGEDFYRMYQQTSLQSAPEDLALQDDALVPIPPQEPQVLQPYNSEKNVYWGDLHVHTEASFDVVARRSDTTGSRTVTLPYFSTVLRGGSSVVSKRVGNVTLQFADGQERAQASGTAAAYVDRAAATLPEDIREHMKLMCDIIAMAFQTDKTRIGTLLMCRDISSLVYPFLNVRISHHFASHKDTEIDYERISTYYVEQLAYLAQRLQAMPEGETTVLDNSLLYFVNNMWSGQAHDNSKLPVLTVGGLRGTLETGRVLDFQGRPDEERRLCGLYLSLMDRMGLRLQEFGDAKDRLTEV